MPAPNEETIEGIRILLCSGIDAGMEDPFTLIGAHLEDMVSLVMEAPARAEEFASAVRQHAINAGWPRTRVNRLTLSRYEREASVRRQREREQQRTVIQAASRFTEAARAEGGARRGRPRFEEVRQQIGAMTPEQRIDSDSLYLIAAGHIEHKRRGRLWFDSFLHRHITDWHGAHDDAATEPAPFTDEFERRVHAWLNEIDPRMSKASLGVTQAALKLVSEADQRNALQDWLGALVWDGEVRLPTFLHKVYGTPDDEYHTAVGRNWFLSMVARMKWPGCKVDTMPVLIGAQGIHKSQSLEVIGGDWYAASVSEIGTEKFRQELQGCVVFEIPELHSFVSSRVGASHIKAVLSTAVDRFRPAYGHNVGTFKRTAVAVGTTNDRGWHNDDTGGRRFWPIICGGEIDLQWLRDNRDMLFAEAKVAIDSGEPWWIVPKAEQEARIENERVEDPWEEVIIHKLSAEPLCRSLYDMDRRPHDGNFGQSADWGNLLTTLRILVQWLGVDPEHAGRYTKRVGGILRRLGWEQHRVRLGRDLYRAWFLRVVPDEGDEGANVPDSPPVVPDEIDDIPF